AGVRSVADAKARDRLVIEPAPLEVFAGIGPLGPPQTFLEKRGSAHMHVDEHHANVSVAGLLRTGKRDLGHGHAQLLSNQPKGFREGDVLDLLDKGEDISRLSAAKAVIKLPCGMHRKRRRLLGMKRTKPRKVLRPSLLQLDVVANDANDIRLLLEGLFEVVGGSRSH